MNKENWEKYEEDLKPFWDLPIFDWLISNDAKIEEEEKNKSLLVEIIDKIVNQARQEERERIKEDINSVLNMVEGGVENRKIANYIKEYLLN